MSSAVITIRPQPGCTATVAAGKALGLDVLGAPLSEIRACEWDAPDPSNFDALLIGSANVFRSGGAQLAAFINLPVHAVGETTAKIAGEAGFSVTHIGSGGLQGLLDGVAEEETAPIRYLRLAGAEHMALVRPAHMTISTFILYENRPLSMPVSLAKMLEKGGVVLLHSAAAARHFLSECERLGLNRGRISLASLGPRIKKAAGTGWAQSRAARSPDDAGILALAQQMCHEAPYK